MGRAIALALAAAFGLAGCAAARKPAANSSCKEALPAEPKASPFALRFDQLGYAPGSALWAVLTGAGQPAPGFRIFDAQTGCRIGQGTAGPRLLATTSRAGTPLTVDRVDLSSIRGPG